MNKGFLIGAGIFVVLGVMFAVWAIGLSNTEKKLFLTGKAAQQNAEIIFDKTWKTIQTQAGVTDQYKEGFRAIYVDIANARYASDSASGKETLMKWVTESNPTFDPSLYKTLMNTIEGSRNEFAVEQKKLIDIDRQHKSMKITFPNSLIIGGRPDLEIKLVTSAKTEEAYKTGQENDIDPFKKN
jgi:hypothetical protein